MVREPIFIQGLISGVTTLCNNSLSLDDNNG